MHNRDKLEIILREIERLAPKVRPQVVNTVKKGENVPGFVKLVLNNFSFVRINVRNNNWACIEKTNDKERIISKGKGIGAAVRSYQGRMQKQREEGKKTQQERKREKRYKKVTKANIMHRLTQAEKYHKEQGMSMSKAARTADVEYKFFKQYLEGTFNVDTFNN